MSSKKLKPTARQSFQFRLLPSRKLKQFSILVYGLLVLIIFQLQIAAWLALLLCALVCVEAYYFRSRYILYQCSLKNRMRFSGLVYITSVNKTNADWLLESHSLELQRVELLSYVTTRLFILLRCKNALYKNNLFIPFDALDQDDYRKLRKILKLNRT
ncbi:MAG: hypothetical protein JKY93_10885 [Gammaproteobacteria bacterium]|nr:hypothetical protein [Gammaproteobacteria bacterium]